MISPGIGCTKRGVVTPMSLADMTLHAHSERMFCVDEAVAETIRRAFTEHWELSAVVEFRQDFPLITGYAKALGYAPIIAGWDWPGR